MSYGKNDVINVATKLGRLANGGVIGYYAGGKTSEIMSKTIPDRLIAAVERHKKIHLGASLAQSFIPGADVAATAAIVASLWKMYYDINQVLGIKISENVGKSLTSAVLTNFGSAVVKGASTAVSEGAKLIPFVGWIASAGISAMTSTAIIYGSAYVYMNALTIMYKAKGKFDIDYLIYSLSGKHEYEGRNEETVYAVNQRNFIHSWHELNVVRNGKKGMVIHTSFEVENMKGQMGVLIISYKNSEDYMDCLDENGEEIRSEDYFFCDYDSCIFEDYEFFVPYYAFSNVDTPFFYEVDIFNEDGKWILKGEPSDIINLVT